MDPQPVAVRLVEGASVVDFDATAVFKISNIRRYFEGDPEAKSSDGLTFSTPSFGPGLYIDVSPNEKGEGMDIHLHLPKAKYIPQPIAVKYSVTVFPLSRCTSEDTKELFHVGEESDEWKVGDAGGRGWSPAVDLGDWEDHESLRSDNGLCLVVQAKSLRDYPTPDSPPALDVLHKTIVATPSPITVRFTAFSRRALSGKLSNPCILSVDRGVIDNSCPVLSQIVSNTAPWDGLLVKQPSHGSQMASESTSVDSDFEDDDGSEYNVDDTADTDHARPSSPPRYSLSEGSTLNDSENDEKKFALTHDNYMASTLVSIPDNDDQMQVDDDSKDAAPTRAIRSVERKESLDVVVVGAAAVTWEALMFYLYTGTIEFAPLKSSGRENRDSYIKDHTADNRPKPCSPKSIYALADKMKLKHLRRLALKKITKQLNTGNILVELFSSFTSRYDEIKTVEMKLLTKHWDQIMGSDGFQRIMSEVANGKYPHAGDILAEVFKKMKPDQ